MVGDGKEVTLLLEATSGIRAHNVTAPLLNLAGRNKDGGVGHINVLVFGSRSQLGCSTNATIHTLRAHNTSMFEVR